jgi:hypothetical protein
MGKHYFNILTFTHPKEELTYFFSDKDQPNLSLERTICPCCILIMAI